MPTAMPVRLVPMSPAEFEAYVEVVVPDYASENVRAGRWTSEEALTASRAEITNLLPQGLSTPGQFLFEVVNEPGGAAVGAVWISLRDGPRPLSAFLYDIRLRPEQRGKGLGSATMEAVEGFVQQRGAGRLSLNVFGHNEVARRLYVHRGFTTVAEQMSKLLGPRAVSGSSGPP